MYAYASLMRPTLAGSLSARNLILPSPRRRRSQVGMLWLQSQFHILLLHTGPVSWWD
ncbi:unnamed protein product, partial [Brassica oleracea var. botrytis]